MKILHRYILRSLLRNLALSLLVFTILFLVFDFFDRVDNLMVEGTSFWLIIEYYLLKVPLIVSFMLPIAMLVATMFTVGLMAKNSEITAMRSAGLPVLWIARPIFLTGLAMSLFALLLNETLVPYSTRRGREIYNIDIRQKDKQGAYSQSDFWWRAGNRFYSVDMFDSRTNSLLNLSEFQIGQGFLVERRLDAKKASWIGPDLGWSMNNVSGYTFSRDTPPSPLSYKSLSLPISERPEDFYDMKTDVSSLSFFQLRKFIKKQSRNGVAVSGYLADLHEKLAFPFFAIIATLVVLPFSLKPARSGSMASSLIAGLIIGFCYYAVHAFSISVGRAELWPPVLAAWMANFVMGFVGLVLNLGAEAP